MSVERMNGKALGHSCFPAFFHGETRRKAEDNPAEREKRIALYAERAEHNQDLWTGEPLEFVQSEELEVDS